jgi:hypothetical protein
MAKSGHKGISRIDQEDRNHHGWYVRVSFGGQKHAKFFSDAKHGGGESALVAAVAHRDQIEKEFGKPRTERQVAPKTARNTSGVVGVRRRTRTVARGEEIREYYEVSWNPWPGKVCRKMFSITHLGDRQAFLAACAFRRQKERETFGGEVKGNWVASLPTILAS